MKPLLHRFKKLSTSRRDFWAQNLHHPSLRAKKYDEASDIWQARINRDWRFYFAIERDEYVILGMTPHPK